jgi:hypothetical protein
VPIYKSLEAELVGDARTLLAYQDDTPALIERVIGAEKSGTSGRVLLWTTALARQPRQDLAWNEFPIANWSWVQIMTQTIPYLSGNMGRKLAIEAGESVTLPVDPGLRLTDVNAQAPGQGQVRALGDLTPGRPLVVSTRATNLKPENMIGQWTVTATRPEGPPLALGFSVNPPLAESEIAPLASEELDPLLGKQAYTIADTFEGLMRDDTEGTVGRELFPWLMLFLLLLVTGENALANLFYRERAPANTARPRAPAVA